MTKQVNDLIKELLKLGYVINTSYYPSKDILMSVDSLSLSSVYYYIEYKEKDKQFLTYSVNFKNINGVRLASDQKDEYKYTFDDIQDVIFFIKSAEEILLEIIENRKVKNKNDKVKV